MSKWINDKDGYLIHHKTGIPQHRSVHIEHYGRPPKGWHIHHCNCDKLDNRPANLVALSPKHHNDLHAEMRELRRTFTREDIIAFPRYERELSLAWRIEDEIARKKREIAAMEQQLETSLGVVTKFKTGVKAHKKKEKRKRKQRKQQAKKQAASDPSPPKLSKPRVAPSPYVLRRGPVDKSGPANDIEAILAKRPAAS